ncbi:MAG TPA: aminoglycoside phosphotransferase family protein [Acidimicrobiales bacterium]|nr:aminoglycoside phosphotransferase family protein [Acidimicrobiales bacterium]
MSWPPAEVNIDTSLVGALVRAQFPIFGELDCLLVAEGFDNSLWRLGDDLVVRLPRREAAVALSENERRWLHEVARGVTLRTPLPLLAGAPSDLYPWPWLITSWIDGVPGDQIDLQANGSSARALASFLRELHVEAPADAPRSPVRGVALSSRSTTFQARLTRLRDHVDEKALQELWVDCVGAPPWSSASRWLHGDFHPANTLYRDGELVGVIDFGDLCAGDPATDLAGGLLSLPFDALDDFFGEYGFIDEATLRRTIGWALLFGVFMVSLGIEGRPTYRRVGELALKNATQVARKR